MTPTERLKRFNQARTRELRAWSAASRQSDDAVLRVLKKAEARLQRSLKDGPTEWGTYYYGKKLKEIEAILAEREKGLSEAAGYHQDLAFSLGRDLLDVPLSSAGFNVKMLGAMDMKQMEAMKNFMTGKMRDVARRGQQKINDQLGLVLAGVQTPQEAFSAISGMLGGDQGRALTVLRTELGRAYSTATQARMEEAKTYLPGLKKKWQKSGKRHGRLSHIAAHGQVQDVDKPFLVGGELIPFPRAPGVSAENSINCGCDSIPWMERWTAYGI